MLLHHLVQRRVALVVGRYLVGDVDYIFSIVAAASLAKTTSDDYWIRFVAYLFAISATALVGLALAELAT